MDYNEETSWLIPEEIKKDLARIGADFHLKNESVPIKDVQTLMAETIQIYNKFLNLMDEADKQIQ